MEANLMQRASDTGTNTAQTKAQEMEAAAETKAAEKALLRSQKCLPELVQARRAAEKAEKAVEP